LKKGVRWSLIDYSRDGYMICIINAIEPENRIPYYKPTQVNKISKYRI